MKLSRRSFMKANAVAAAAAAAGLSVPGVARAVVGQQEAIKWDKAPCRFCGTGCGVLVGTQQGREEGRTYYDGDRAGSRSASDCNRNYSDTIDAAPDGNTGQGI